MKRAIIKWWISHAIDQSVELPGWLRLQIERDAELKRFERGARRLERGLRDEARRWLADAGACEEVVRPRGTGVECGRRSVSRRWAWWLATAAVLLLVAGPFFTLPTDHHGLPASTAAGRADATALLTLLDASEALLRPWQQVTSPSHWPAATWSLRNVSRATAVVERGTERAWADMKSSLHQKQQLITADLKSACDYFSRRLPLSVVWLMGGSLGQPDSVDS